ncbi:MAG TPA: 30S ribosomal protein S9 [Persephonella sp.]|uniref:Small ribosomal subunit protein uS9 n=1 Tax=Persephonella marina (strain DSM 14350 / EX-H1) TaxID=123214 RepID=C0QU55_PERMH|nr:ribosomal protein S9 [Persephonella marina EX-H1]HCB70163.1 30S ribosomal protein S9 [Persephonella sp.]
MAEIVKIDPKVAKYGTGRRKEAVARVWIFPGEGKIYVRSSSGKEWEAPVYFEREILMERINRPFAVTETLGKFDVYATVKGSGKPAQAEAVMYGIAKALLQYNPDFRPVLKSAGLLTRDARVKERKKYAQMGARAKYRWSKR